MSDSENKTYIFAAMLRKIINESGYKNDFEFAEKVGIPTSTISDWLYGVAPSTRHPGLLKLMEFSKMSYHQICYGSDLRIEELEKRIRMQQDIISRAELLFSEGRAIKCEQLDIEDAIRDRGAA